MATTAHVAATTDEVPFLDITDPAFSFSSAEVIAAQARSWYARSPVGLVVLGYPEANELLRDRRLNHNGVGYLEMNGIVDGPIYDWFVPMILNREGSAHRGLRNLVNRAFTVRMVDNLRPFIRQRAERLAGWLATAGECDFVEEFANPLPLAVMSELLGVRADDFETFRVWTNDIGLVFNLAHGGDTAARVETAIIGLYEYVDQLISRKEASPTDDLVSHLLRTWRSDSDASRDELRNLIVTLVFAAHDTTRHQLANAMTIFAEHPDQWTLLAERPGLIDQAVEEVMRWRPSAATVFRFAAEDFDYRGLHIADGTFLTVCVLAAQRDPRVFPDGSTFDITVTRPAGPLQFGGGPHHCLGAALARAELGEALPALASRLGPPRITGPASWRPQLGIYGPNNLPLTFPHR